MSEDTSELDVNEGLDEGSEVVETPADPPKRRRRRPPRVREYILPLMTVAALAVLVITFRTILLPFILACLLVYLMEPLVSRMGRSQEHPNRLPRWIAVLLVYLVSITLVVSFLVAIVPRFVAEFIRFGETVPELVNEVRTEDLPKIDAQVEQFVSAYLPMLRSVDVTATASSKMFAARKVAARQALAAGHARANVRRSMDMRFEHRKVELAPDIEGNTLMTLEFSAFLNSDQIPAFTLSQSVDGGRWRFATNQEPAFRLVPDKSGGLQVYLNNVDIEVERREERWVVRRTSDDALPPMPAPPSRGLSLQKNVDDLLQEFVDNSTSQIGRLIEFARKLAVGIVEGFVGIVLTLMVAAFISIDLHRVRRFFRTLVPEDGRAGFDRFLQMADRGMAGVVRGQLLICLVNGVLTYIGLAVLGVRFSLLLAVLAGILSLIPVFGTVLSTVPIVAIGLADGFSTGLLALGWILLIHFLEANFLNPKIIGQSAHIHPVIVIFALLAGESAFGLVGALLAVPTASLLLTVFNFVRLRAWRPEENSPEIPT